MFRRHQVNLEVHQQPLPDVYRDRARIPELFRGCIREGRICKLSVGGQNTLLEIRGYQDASKPIMRLGELSRRALGVEAGKTYAFCIREVFWIGQFRWAWNAADSAARIAARLGLLGTLLGILGVILALAPLLKR